MQKPDSYLSAILIVFLALLIVKCLQPSTDARDLVALGSTIVAGIFALVQSRKPDSPNNGDKPDA